MALVAVAHSFVVTLLATTAAVVGPVVVVGLAAVGPGALLSRTDQDHRDVSRDD